jgi:hypothetical protein
MGKPQPQPSSKSKTDHRRERVQRTTAKRTTASAPTDAPGAPSVDELVVTWKDAHITEAKAKVANKAARDAVSAVLREAPNHLAVTSVGTVAMSMRAGAKTTNWEALARAYVADEEIERVLPEYTTTGEGGLVLAAPKEWGVEAKSAA